MTDVTIRLVNNGFLVSGPEGQGAFGVPDPTDEQMVESLAAALWAVTEQLGMIGDRYDSRRIRITTEPGDKWMLYE